MLRSRRAGLSLPDSLGRHFGGNGDFFALAYNTVQRADVLRWGTYPDSPRAIIRSSQLETGALNHTLAYLVNGHEDQNGAIELDPLPDEPKVKWSGAGKQASSNR